MKLLILADIHSNLDAFQACLDDARKRGGFDRILSLGDVVGYGPQPNECIRLLRGFDHAAIAGNHDWAAIGKLSTMEFNPDAAAAAQWTARELGVAEREYLEKLPTTLREEGFLAVHGSPRSPIWEYLVSAGLARMNFTRFEDRYCLVGHSHVPLLFDYDDKTTNCRLRKVPRRLNILPAKRRMIVNPGGVGQPRDGDRRASYMLFDREAGTLSHFRVSYDIAGVQRLMVERGLPESLIGRLDYGL